MKFTLVIGGTKVVMNAEQLDALTNVLDGCDQMYDHSVEKGTGTHGYNMGYIHHIRPYNINESLEVKVMSQEQYEATKLVTKLHKEE
jgi:hypothetical protein